MTSDPQIRDASAYVWVWLPNTASPIVCGRLSTFDHQLVFNYGRSYLSRSDAVSLYDKELPLQSGVLPLLSGLSLPNCIRDAAPDAWGRRVLINRLASHRAPGTQDHELSELTYLLASGSDRIGALDFQKSSTFYRPREPLETSLEDLSKAAEQIELGVPLSADLGLALLHGTSLGGARPKVFLQEPHRKWIAKFSSIQDLYSIVKGEFIAMRLARKVGLEVAHVELTSALGKDILLVERFDRIRQGDCWHRLGMVSALTLLELDYMMAAYASYEQLAQQIRARFAHPKTTLRELFCRIVFNILCGNTDDHARNHAAFWDGHQLSLTPAFDICPQSRSGQEASQAMLIHGKDRSSQLVNCLQSASTFLLSRQEAISIINHQVQTIDEAWGPTCDEAQLSEVERAFFWRRQFLNPFAFQNAPEDITPVKMK